MQHPQFPTGCAFASIAKNHRRMARVMSFKERHESFRERSESFRAREREPTFQCTWIKIRNGALGSQGLTDWQKQAKAMDLDLTHGALWGRFDTNAASQNMANRSRSRSRPTLEAVAGRNSQMGLPSPPQRQRLTGTLSDRSSSTPWARGPTVARVCDPPSLMVFAPAHSMDPYTRHRSSSTPNLRSTSLVRTAGSSGGSSSGSGAGGDSDRRRRPSLNKTSVPMPWLAAAAERQQSWRTRAQAAGCIWQQPTHESDPASAKQEMAGHATQGDHLMRRKARQQTGAAMGAAGMMEGQGQPVAV